MKDRNPLFVFCITVIAIIFAYYFDILLHEWGHGTVAWLLGQKSSAFAVTYGGWALLHADEHVNYDYLLATHQGVSAALIGIAGLSVTVILAIGSFILLDRRTVQARPILFSLCYWVLIINMVAIYQYIPVTTFSTEGDVGRFIHGLNISPLWVFILGTPLVIIALWRIFSIEIPRAYRTIPVKSIWGQRIFLLTSLSIMFLLIYTHGYNPFTDASNSLFGKILACISIFLVPVLFFVCNPSNAWAAQE